MTLSIALKLPAFLLSLFLPSSLLLLSCCSRSKSCVHVVVGASAETATTGNPYDGASSSSKAAVWRSNAAAVAAAAKKKREQQQQKSAAVTYDRRSLLIHGKRTLILSGSIHYTRVPPADWDRVMKLAVELGLNCIQTYVFWNEHEHVQPGITDWDGWADLNRFIDLAADNGLYVNVRIGPYICGEYYFGGIPLWMRHVKKRNDDNDSNSSDSSSSSIQCFRCSDPVWKREMERWVRTVVNRIRHQFAGRRRGGVGGGGNVIMLQIENEYNHYNDYLQWSVDMVRNITAEVVWELCHDEGACSKVNQVSRRDDDNDNVVLCAINGFWMEEGGSDGQPGPEYMLRHWTLNPTQPAVWTEDQGWFDKWGWAQRVRYTWDQLYGMARFVAWGGSYHNLYMLTGGNNYGLRAGGEVTTGYAQDTVIDYLLLRHEPRFSAYRDFFRVLRDHEQELLSHPPAVPAPLSRLQEDSKEAEAATDGSNGSRGESNSTTGEVHVYGSLAFLSNTGDNGTSAAAFAYNGRDYFLTNHSVVIVNGTTGSVLFNTSTSLARETNNAITDDDATQTRRQGQQKQKQQQQQQRHPRHGGSDDSDRIVSVRDWKYFAEHVGYGSRRNPPARSPEQLNITNNDSDYLWYTFYTNAIAEERRDWNPNAGISSIRISPYGYGGMQYVYVNGVLLADNNDEAVQYNKEASSSAAAATTTKRALLRQRQRLPWQVEENLTPEGGGNRVDILSVAMGLYNGGVGPHSTKGIYNVTIGRDSDEGTSSGDSRTGTATYTVFSTAWWFLGEELAISTADGSTKVDWSPALDEAGEATMTTSSLVWFQGRFDLPAVLAPFAGGAQPDQTALAINLAGLNKGVAYVNGFNIGRYWLVTGDCQDAFDDHCAPPRACYLHYKGCGQPTQHLYHVPFQVLKATENLLTVFEETIDPNRDLARVHLEILHDHPDLS